MMRSVQLLTMLLLVVFSCVAEAGNKKVIIGFRQGGELKEQEKYDKVQRAGGKIKRVHSSMNSIVAYMPEEVIDGLKKDPNIAYAEEDRAFTIAEPISVLPSAEYVDSWGVLHIGADVAASSGIRGAGVKVAVLDSGIDYNHPDLKDNYKGGYNFAYDNIDPYDDSIRLNGTVIGHGTHVAGIIAAKDNGTGVVGVAPDASIYAVKVLDYGLMGSTSNIVAGIDWAITNKMNIINMSFGIPFDPLFYSQAVEDACNRAYKAGIIIVAASGNSMQPNVDYPAAFSSVIAVAATTKDDILAPFSNYGTKLELAAPGVDIKSTIPGGGYAVLSGTSQAAPHVTGVAALILSAGIKDSNRDGYIVDEVRRRMDSTAHDLGASGRDIYFGYGLVEAPNNNKMPNHDKSPRNR